MNASAPSSATAPLSLNELSDAQIRQIYFDWRFWARDDQLPPGEDDAWRVWSSTVPSVVYSAAQQVVDFGSVQAAVSVRVYQLSGTGSRGSARAAVV
ncbi:MAG: hypothetical protein B7Y80_06050 [Hyphomicrobium sp. 32-62-53]|nr:MAG: hypothetical protein B7Z29_11780 [Hyphomicrobium sp. 12-62-95]OYY00787.1 MAG: hypothetical protein B7Y80_06050 [Hyphomicrobium sp. 32-62-53]